MSQQLSLQAFSGFLLVRQQQPSCTTVKIRIKAFQCFFFLKFLYLLYKSLCEDIHEYCGNYLLIVGQIFLKPLYVYTNCLICVYKDENDTAFYVRLLLDFKTSYISWLDSIDCFWFESFHLQRFF